MATRDPGLTREAEGALYLSTMTNRPAGKPYLHIPGAGTMAMYVLVASLSVLFASSLLAYCFIRFVKMANQWPPKGYPHLPPTLWVSTVVILLTSGTIQFALVSIKRNNEARLRIGLGLTAALGVMFLILQTFNWIEFASHIGANPHTGPYVNFFYVLTGLHAAHVIGGLIPLAIVLPRAIGGRYSANFHPGVRYCTIYWHFLDIIWVALFVAIYVI